ncbi:NUDIX domain-containing protein [Candidatus Daviesbacteria bacterium]|nr:NUDIX domain-containing protein [Candidatus Daviesbacteria bacterium]
MEEQTILAVDDSGNFLKYISKEEGHKGNGIRHLAITVFIFNSKGEVLLQKRKHKIFDNIWDNTASTHQLHLENGTDETDEEATLRALNIEYGIKDVELKIVGAFSYYAKYGDLCENEFCKLLVGIYDGEINLNSEVGYEYKWMEKREFLKDLEQNPSKYTPWCKAAAKILKKKGIL